MTKHHSNLEPAKILKVVFLTVFLDLLGIGILVPVLPVLLSAPLSPYYILPAGYTVSQGYVLLGLLTMIFPLGQFLAAPVLGELSDRFGRRVVLLTSIAGTAFGYLLFAYGVLIGSIPILFLARAIDGLTGGNIAVAQAVIADISPNPADRVKRFGILGAAFGFGFILGPFLGGKLSDPQIVSWFTASTPFYFASLLALVNIFAVWKFLPETHQHPKSTLVLHWFMSFRNIARAFRMPELRTSFITGFLFQGGFMFYTTFAGAYMIHRFAVDQGDIGNYFAMVGICSVLVQGLVVRKLANHFSPSQILPWSLSLSALMIFLYLQPGAFWVLFAMAPFLSLGVGASNSNLSAFVSSHAPAGKQGEVMGVNASVIALSQTIPPLIAGFLAASLSPSAPILVASATIFLGAFIFLMNRERNPVPLKTPVL